MGLDVVIKFCPPAPLTEKDRRHLAARLNEAMDSVDYTVSDDTEGEIPRYELITPWRYYGPGYERGPWPTIRAVMVWLMRNTNGTVLYGSDADDTQTHFGLYELDKMDAHWARVGHIPYRGPSGNDPVVECKDCGINMNAHSFIGNEVNLICPGCEAKATVTR